VTVLLRITWLHGAVGATWALVVLKSLCDLNDEPLDVTAQREYLHWAHTVGVCDKREGAVFDLLVETLDCLLLPCLPRTPSRCGSGRPAQGSLSRSNRPRQGEFEEGAPSPVSSSLKIS
jgi:hypothetical protein